jgi:uncharacterized protein
VTKLLVIVIAVIAIVWLLRRAVAGPPAPPANPSPEGTPQGDLVGCARCGVNLPKSEAHGVGDAYYCSEEHRRLGPRER